MTRTAVLSLWVLAAGAAACAGEGAADASRGSRNARIEIGKAAPDYGTMSLAGDSVSLAALRPGQVVLLNVWATWCHPCRSEIPVLRALHAKYAGQGLALVGVSVDQDGSDEAIREFMREFSMTYPIWRDPDERVSTSFRVLGVPATFLIDRGGILRWRMWGAIRPGDTTLVREIDRALAAQ